MTKIVYPYGIKEITANASDKVAIYSDGPVTLSKRAGYPNVPATVAEIATTTGGAYTTTAFSAATTVIIEANESPVYYDIGTDAKVKRDGVTQGDPVALNATGAVTAAAILGGIVTSTTAAAVAGTVPTGAVMDAASTWEIGDAVDWSVITTGANAFTVTAAASGHTVVGNAVVAARKAGLFRTRKTAADTFVTYSLANT